MAIVAGTFTATALQKSRVKAAEMWTNPTWTKKFNKALRTLNGVATRQQLTVSRQGAARLADNTICQAATVHWLNDCDATTTACATAFDDTQSTECDFTGTEIGSDSVDYTTDCLYVVNRAVNNTRCKTENDYLEKVAMAEMAAKYNLDNALETGFLTYLNSNKIDWTAAGLSLGIGAVNGVDATIWEVPAASLDSSSMAELMIVAEKARFVDPVIVSGGGYYKGSILARANEGIATTYHSDGLYEENTIFYNINDLTAITSADTLFIVDAAAVGFINSNDYMNPDPVSRLADRTEYYVESDRISWANGASMLPVKYDVRTRTVCDRRNQNITHWQYVASGAYVSAPAACSGEAGNILRIDIT